ncbi:MAG: hypothetical protein IH571_02435 [Acholeplasmataceae bacterium]|nr:hypothetical protein [Acholeplasmataceae bacterium]
MSQRIIFKELLKKEAKHDFGMMSKDIISESMLHVIKQQERKSRIVEDLNVYVQADILFLGRNREEGGIMK